MEAWRTFKPNAITFAQSLRHARGWRGRASLVAPGLLRRSGARILNAGGSHDTAQRRSPEEVILALRDTASALEAAHLDGIPSRDSLEAHVASSQRLLEVQLDDLRDELQRRAFFVNLYNVLTAHAMVDFGIRQSVMERPELFSVAAYRVGPHVWTLDAIEHGILRGNRPHPRGGAPLLRDDARRAWSVPLDARVHMAIVCGAKGCPAIRAYDGVRLDQELDLATELFIDAECAHLDPAQRRLHLSLLFAWYREDFITWTRAKLDDSLHEDEAIWQFLLHHAGASARDQLFKAKQEGYRIGYRPYDWTWQGRH